MKKLLYPLTLNEYSMKDSFQTVEELGKIDYSLLQNGYRLVSFDVVSLFTNVPLKRTINIIVNRIYNEKLIETKIRKHTLKKLILDCCTKTTFSFNDKLYDQIDGVCMGSALGPVLANIIMTELEKLILPKLFEDGVVKFYARYVDDTIVMIKEDKVDSVLQQFNKFDRNLKFTVDTFEDGHVHFLDLTIDTNSRDTLNLLTPGSTPITTASPCGTIRLHGQGPFSTGPKESARPRRFSEPRRSESERSYRGMDFRRSAGRNYSEASLRIGRRRIALSLPRARSRLEPKKTMKF